MDDHGFCWIDFANARGDAGQRYERAARDGCLRVFIGLADIDELEVISCDDFGVEILDGDGWQW